MADKKTNGHFVVLHLVVRPFSASVPHPTFGFSVVSAIALSEAGDWSGIRETLIANGELAKLTMLRSAA